MKKYFNLVNKMELTKKIKIKCYVEIVINYLLRVIIVYPFVLLQYLFFGLQKAFEFLNDLFYSVADYLKEKINVTVLNDKEMEIIRKELKKTIDKYQVK